MKILVYLFTFSLSLNFISAQPVQKHRVIVLTDIEADPDDTESLVRLLLYSNEIDIKGIIATTSCWHKTMVNPESVKRIVKAYGKVQPYLVKHDAAFPGAQTIDDIVKQGIPEYGMSGVGDSKDSEGSAWLINELEKNDDRPLWVSVWGGSNTLAQALYRIRKTKSEKEVKSLVAKLRVYAISDQDDSGIWLRNNFPDLFYIVSPGDDYMSATWSAINSFIPGIDNERISNAWLEKFIQQGHGPLGAVYPDVAYGMEGDTPSWLNLIQNGLSDPEHPEWGGWGGRYEFYKPELSPYKGSSGVPHEAETRKTWTDATDNYTPYVCSEYGRTAKPDSVTFTSNKVSLWRWRGDFQNDFAARMDWCTKSYEEANHAPIIVLDHPEQITVKSGRGFGLDAFNSTDPDGDNLSFQWFNYPEAGSYKKLIKLDGAENLHGVYIIAPKVDKKETAHFIVKVTDKGTPQLTSYKRIIVTIEP
jgi:hypothetical protein